MASDSDDGIKKERDPILLVGFIVLVLAFSVVCGVYVYDEYLSAEDNPQAFTGSAVKVDYTGSYYDFLSSDNDNAVVFDTSLWIVANGDSAKSYEFTLKSESSYSPLSFTVGVSTSYLDAFMNSVIGLRIGESSKVCIAPADGYGELTLNDLWDSGNLFSLSQTIRETSTINISDFKEAYNDGKDVVAGMVLPSPYGDGWDVLVLSVNNVSVTFQNLVTAGVYTMSDNVSVEVTSVGNGNIDLKYIVNGGLQKVPEIDRSIVSDGSDPRYFTHPTSGTEYDNVKQVRIFYEGKFYFITAMDKNDSNKVILRNAVDSDGNGIETKGMYLFFDVKRV